MTLDPGGIIAWLVVGLIAGWLAGMVMKGSYGVIGNIVIGIIGAFVGGFVFSLVTGGGTAGFWGSIAVAFVGAVIADLHRARPPRALTRLTPSAARGGAPSPSRGRPIAGRLEGGPSACGCPGASAPAGEAEYRIGC